MRRVASDRLPAQSISKPLGPYLHADGVRVLSAIVVCQGQRNLVVARRGIAMREREALAAGMELNCLGRRAVTPVNQQTERVAPARVDDRSRQDGPLFRNNGGGNR